jgi:hypothetical protein
VASSYSLFDTSIDNPPQADVPYRPAKLPRKNRYGEGIMRFKVGRSRGVRRAIDRLEGIRQMSKR